MNIAIIGTGNIGAGIALVLGKTKHGVVVADTNGGTEAAAKLKAEGVTVQAADIATAVKSAEVVILATPYGAAAEVAKAADFTGKIVVDLSNPVKEDFSGLLLGHDSSAAEEIAKLVPGARVVKAFNTIFAQHYPAGLSVNGQPLQTFVASDDEAARDVVIGIAKDMGLDARAAGGLSNARYLEPLGYMNIQFGYMLGAGVGIAPAWVA